ncbi:MAG: tetratricopeptide repeat protein [Thermodesulfobacteriota bacterium]
MGWIKIIALIVLLLGPSACGKSREVLKKEASIHYDLGSVHLREGNLPRALRELTPAVEKYPDNAIYHNALGFAYFENDMNQDAIRHFKRAIEIDKEFSEAHINLSAVYLGEERWDDAIDETNKAISNIFYTTPEFAYLNRGRGYYEKAEYKKAIEDFKRSIKANSRYVLAYYNLGLAYKKIERYRDAKAAFNILLKYAPNNIDAHYNLGLIYLKVRDNENAKREFKEVIRIFPEGDLARSSREYVELLK